jgi:hypothetical protein
MRALGAAGISAAIFFQKRMQQMVKAIAHDPLPSPPHSRHGRGGGHPREYQQVVRMTPSNRSGDV